MQSAFARAGRGRAAGFSIIELLVVAGIIGIMVAVAVPAIGTYIRTYRINAASRELANDLSAARAKAIMKNVNYGVVFFTPSANTYRFVVEDDLTPNIAPRFTRAMTIAEAVADPVQRSPLRRLPERVVFGTGCTGFAPNDTVLRFTNLGAWCDPGATACAPVTGAPATPLVMNCPGAGCPAGFMGSMFCLQDTANGLNKVVTVALGGRVAASTRWGQQ